mmetsp:Transcript_15029/g.27318  ORF Transcript_15029/g.27318 Transcript_15029/m.27318 type:complete len:80 (-) Transcript_15029:439-678(-)
MIQPAASQAANNRTPSNHFALNSKENPSLLEAQLITGAHVIIGATWPNIMACIVCIVLLTMQHDGRNETRSEIFHEAEK